MKTLTILPHDITLGQAVIDGERHFALLLCDEEAGITVQTIFSFEDLQDVMPNLCSTYREISAARPSESYMVFN